MKATYLDTVRMDGLLLHARAILAEAAHVAAGHLTRLTIYTPGAAPTHHLYPARVAAYAQAVLTAHPPVAELARVTFYSQGIATVVVAASLPGYYDFHRALRSYDLAQLRRSRRQYRRAKAQLRQSTAERDELRRQLGEQEGGPQQ